MFRNIEKENVITKCKQIDNTVVDGYFTTQELYELSVKAGEQTIENIREFKKNREAEIKERNKALENVDENTVKNLRSMKDDIKDKVDYIDKTNKISQSIEQEKKKYKSIQKEIEKEKIKQEALLSSYKDIGTAEALNHKENIEIAKRMAN